MSTQNSSPLNLIALGWALSATLVILFAACLVVAQVFPEWQASHAWVELFSVAPLNSVRVWLDGIVFSIVFGWVAAVAFGFTYNQLLKSRR
jgi:hypothetical protein